MITWASSSHFNRVEIIYCLNDKDAEDCEFYLAGVGPILLANFCSYAVYRLKGYKGLVPAMETIAKNISHGAVPIIQLIMHGHKTDGLNLIDGCLSWKDLAQKLREINILTHNNLIVLSNVCYSAELALHAPITRPAPFYGLIAPEKELSLGDFEHYSSEFFTKLFELKDLRQAFEHSLKESCIFIPCEEMLLYHLHTYLRDSVIGAAGRQRSERLLTEMKSRGLIKDRNQMRFARKHLKLQIKPDSGLIDTYVSRFMIGRQIDYSLNDVELFTKSTMALKDVANRLNRKVERARRPFNRR